MKSKRSLLKNINTANNVKISTPTFMPLLDSQLLENSIEKRQSNNGANGLNGMKITDQTRSQLMSKSSTKSINQENTDSVEKISMVVPFLSSE